MDLAMKVVYQTVLVFFLFSCASSSIYRISHEHLERNFGYYSLGIWVYGDYWVEMLDNPVTSYPFDEAIWKSTEDGLVNYIDIVAEDGRIHRYGWNWGYRRFKEITILEFEDTSMTPFMYIYILLTQKRVPI